jgi:ubiquinone/menaquinone biosynthesis C-methylase UbiE
MLEKLRTKFPQADSVANALTLTQANAQRLPQLASGSVDGVTILLALYDMDRPHEALAEAIRILRPGGTIVITEPKICFDLGVLLQHAEALLKAQADYGLLRVHFQRVFHANRELNPTARADRLRAEEIHRLLIDGGFRSVAMTDSHLGQCATIIGTKPVGGSE